MPTWRRGGYVIREYGIDHPPRHVHVFRDGRLIDRFDLENGVFMDGTIGRHRGRVLRVLRELMLLPEG